MAAPSVLGCGRAVTRQVLRLEAPGLRGAAPSAALCTRPAGSGTPPPNVVAPQGSTKLLAIKAPVEFPKMLSSSSLLASASKGESTPSTNLEEASKPAEDMRMFMSRKTVVAFPQRVVASTREEESSTSATEGGVRKELGEEETSSSSSSDSDSSSDSEEETEDSEVAVKTKVEFPRQDSIFSENIAVKASMLAKEGLPQKSHKECVAKKSRKKETDVSSVKQAAFLKASVKQETPRPKARDPKVKTAPKEADSQKLVLKPHMVERQDLTDVTHRSDYLEEKSIGTQVAALQLTAALGPREGRKEETVSRGEEKKVKEARESEAQEGAASKLEETPESTVVVMGTTAKEETLQEAGVQAGERSAIEETTAAAEPAPEEFDNSTYKNLQHHDYNIYTFADYVAVLSKFRQPQPSSGRPSPRH